MRRDGPSRRDRHLAPADADTFAVYGSELFLGFYEKTTGGVFALLTVTSTIGLAVGGIGLMNVMFMSVRQRTREIGVRRAVGAPPPIIAAGRPWRC